MPKIVDIRHADDPRDVIHLAVETLADERLVVFPTETSYVLGAHSLMENAVARLKQAVATPGEFSFQLAIKGPQAALDFVPDLGCLGRRLARRCWPGPVSLVVPVPERGSLLAALPPDVRSCLAGTGRVVLRVPAHAVLQEVLKLMPAPLLITPDTAGRDRGASTTDQLNEPVAHEASLILDDGPARYNQAETIVAVSGDRWRIVRPGIVKEATLRRLASRMYLFVCTGNTCRSPLAEGLFRKLLAERLECSEEELPDHGVVVMSAGLAAAAGSPASPEAVAVAARRGVDLRGHESQPLTERLLEQTDRIYTMTSGHRETILAERPDLSRKVELLARDGSDIPDPIGFGMEEYLACQREIDRNLRILLEQIAVEES